MTICYSPEAASFHIGLSRMRAIVSAALSAVRVAEFFAKFLSLLHFGTKMIYGVKVEGQGYSIVIVIAMLSERQRL